MAKAEKRTVRLKRSIIVDAEHTPKGTLLSLPVDVCQGIVADGSAEYVSDPEGSKEEVRNSDPLAQNREPKAKKA